MVSFLLCRRYLSVYRENSGLHIFSSSEFSLLTLKPKVHLSGILAKLYPEFTVPIFSGYALNPLMKYIQNTLELQKDLKFRIVIFLEMCGSILRQHAIEKRRLLVNMLPWLRNVELVDNDICSHTTGTTNMVACGNLQEIIVNPKRLRGEGWGSVNATEVVLCNLFHITCKVTF